MAENGGPPIGADIDGSVIESTTGIDEVDFQRLDEDQRELTVDVYTDPAVVPHLSYVEWLSDYTPEGFPHTGASAASYVDEERAIVISTYMFENEPLEATAGSVGPNTPETSLVHEAGHAAHFRNIESEGAGHPYGWDIEKHRMLREVADTVRREVSEYALANEMEFVAETFTEQMLGGDVPDEVLDVYDEYHGPEVTSTYELQRRGWFW